MHSRQKDTLFAEHIGNHQHRPVQSVLIPDHSQHLQISIRIFVNIIKRGCLALADPHLHAAALIHLKIGHDSCLRILRSQIGRHAV